MRALVLGGNGFIGSHLVDELLRQGSYVRVFDKYPEFYRPPIDGVDYVIGDFGNRAMVSGALEDIDVVFHLVSTTLPQTSNDDPIFDVQSNVIETLALLQECVSKSISRFVYISSGGTVYGLPSELPVPEDSQTFPLCSYGIVKLTVEKYLGLFRHLYGLDYIVVRPSNPFGPRQNPRGAQGVISVSLGCLLEGRSISVWGDGSVVRDYIYITDLVDGIVRASISNGQHRIFNLGSGKGVKLNDVIQICSTCVEKTAKIDYMAPRGFDIPAVYLDINRAIDELDWHPGTSMIDGVSMTVEFLQGFPLGQTMKRLACERSNVASEVASPPRESSNYTSGGAGLAAVDDRGAVRPGGSDEG